MSFVNCYLPYFRQQLITCLLSAIYFCRLCLLKVHVEFSYLPLFPSPVGSEHPALSVACPFQFLVYYSVFFLWGGSQSVQGAMLVYPRRSCGNTACRLFAHLLVCFSQAGLEPASVSVGALLVSQCNMARRSFVQAGVSECQSFASSWWFFSAKCGSSIPARFLIYGSHAVCFLPLVAILDPSKSLFSWSCFHWVFKGPLKIFTYFVAFYGGNYMPQWCRRFQRSQEAPLRLFSIP
jgi:hypothetical protein